MTKSTIEAMVGTLQKSVTAIIESGAPESQDLLAKSFSEFQEALTGEVDGALAKAAPAVEEPLYKGFGCVGRVASLVSTIASSVQPIINGHERYQDPANLKAAELDPASPELAHILEGLLSLSELALRTAVNECCEPIEDGEDPADMHLIMVPLANGSGEAAVKTVLPTDLAKFATDPTALQMMALEQGFNLLGAAGADVQALEKMLNEGGELLSKAAGGEMGEGGEPDATSMLPEDPDSDPLDTIGRLCALIMIVVDQLKQEVDGAAPNDPTGEDNGSNATDAGGPSDTAAGAGGTPAQEGDPTQQTAQKAAPSGDLAKIGDLQSDEVLSKALAAKGINIEQLVKLGDEYAGLQKAHQELTSLANELLQKAEAPKAPLVVAGTVTKGQEDGLAPVPSNEDEALAKMDPKSRALAMVKNTHNGGGRPVS